MRKVATSLAVLAFATSSWAGTVDFLPGAANVLPGDTATFNVVVSSSELATFDTVFLVIGSDVPRDLDMTYAPSFVDLTTVDPGAPAPFGIYAPDRDVAFGGNRFATPAFQAPLLIGTLSIDTTGLLEGSSYDIWVSTSREENDLGFSLTALALGTGASEGLEGAATLNIVPEPATLMMLAMGGMAVAYRRRTV